MLWIYTITQTEKQSFISSWNIIQWLNYIVHNYKAEYEGGLSNGLIPMFSHCSFRNNSTGYSTSNFYHYFKKKRDRFKDGEYHIRMKNGMMIIGK